MKSILFFLLLFWSNLLIGQEFKDYFAITVVPQSPTRGYQIQLKDGCLSKDSAVIDGVVRMYKHDSLVLSSFQKTLPALLREEIIDKYHVDDLHLHMYLVCNREGVVCDCIFSVDPKYIQYLSESLLVQIYTAFITEVEPIPLSNVIDQSWLKDPRQKRPTGYTMFLVRIGIDLAQNQVGVYWPRHAQ